MRYQITFAWPNGDWTWINRQASDFHQAIFIALEECPTGCRVRNIEREPEGKSFGLVTQIEKEKARG
jgi:hypothetical protein